MKIVIRGSGRCWIALWLAALLSGCSVAEYRKMYFPAFRPAPASKKIEASVVIETTGTGYDKNMAKAFSEVMAEDLAMLFTMPSLKPNPDAEFILRGSVAVTGVFPPTTVDVTVTLLEQGSTDPLVSLNRKDQDSTFVGDMRMRAIADKLVRSVLASLKEDLVRAFDDPKILAKRRWQAADVKKLLVEAQKAMETGDAATAVTSLRRALLKDPKSGEAYQQTGELMLILCDPKAATPVLEKGLELNPENQQLQRLLEEAKGQDAAASKAGHSKGCRAQALNQEGVALARDGRAESALEKFKGAAALASGYVPKADFNAALILEELGRSKEALDHYLAAYRSFVMPMEQVEVLERLVALSKRMRISVPESTDRKYRIGIVRSQQKRYREAIEQFEAALEEAPWMVDAYYNLGLVYDLTGAYPSALRVFHVYAKLSPSSPNIGQVKTKIVELEDKLGLLAISDRK